MRQRSKTPARPAPRAPASRQHATAPARRSLGATTGQSLHTQKRGFTKAKVAYDPTDEIDPYIGADLALTKAIADKLQAHYPAHPWMVKVTHAQGVAMIKLPLVMKRHQEFVLHIDKLKSDPGLRAVVRAGGEILERYNMPRHGFSLERFLDARAEGPYGAKTLRPKPRLFMPEFATSARPRTEWPRTELVAS